MKIICIMYLLFLPQLIFGKENLTSQEIKIKVILSDQQAYPPLEAIGVNLYDHEDNLIERRIFNLDKDHSFILKNPNKKIATLMVEPLPSLFYQVKYMTAHKINLQEATGSITMELITVAPKKITIIVKAADGTLLKNKTMKLYDSRLKEEYTAYDVETDVNGQLSFYGYPNQEYHLEVLRYGDGYTISNKSPTYTTDQSITPIVWRFPNMRMIRIQLLNRYNDKTTSLNNDKYTDICVTNVTKQNSFYAKINNGATTICLDDENLQGAQKIKFSIGVQLQVDGYQIVEGETLDINDKVTQHKIVFSNEKQTGDLQWRAVAPSSNAPLTGKIFILSNKDKKIIATTANSLALMPGSYDVIVFSPIYNLQRKNNIKIVKGEKTEIDFSLSLGEKINGTITAPQVGEIYPFLHSTIASDLRFDEPQNLSADGKFSFHCDLRLRPYLVIMNEEMANVAVPLTAANADKPIEITLQKGVTVRGKISPSLQAIIKLGYQEFLVKQLKGREEQCEVTPSLQIAFFPLGQRGIFTAGADIAEDHTWQTQVLPGKYQLALMIGGSYYRAVAEFADPIEIPNTVSEMTIEKFSTPEEQLLKFIPQDEYLFRESLFEEITE